MSSRPWMKMYPGDWRRHAGVQSCSLAARGLWHELLMVMHECEPYGRLRIGGKIPDVEGIARLVGSKAREVKLLLAELEFAEVFSRDEDGAIFSRRMVKDERARQLGIACGLRGGNPALLAKRETHNGSDADGDKGTDNTPPDARAHARADSDSDSGSESTLDRTEPCVEQPPPLKLLRKRKTDPADIGAILAEHPTLDRLEFRAALALWIEHRREKKCSPLRTTAARALLAELAEMGIQRAVAAILHSIARDWKSIHEPNGDARRVARKSSYEQTLANLDEALPREAAST